MRRSFGERLRQIIDAGVNASDEASDHLAQMQAEFPGLWEEEPRDAFAESMLSKDEEDQEVGSDLEVAAE